MPAIIFFDGVCNLCNRFVAFIIRNDKEKKFYFSPLQGETAKTRLPVEITRGVDSVILLEDDKIYTKSAAALRIARSLKGLWPLAYGLMIVPGFIRNSVYDLVARRRYKWFGKKEACMVPTPELRARFLP